MAGRGGGEEHGRRREGRKFAVAVLLRTGKREAARREHFDTRPPLFPPPTARLPAYGLAGPCVWRARETRRRPRFGQSPSRSATSLPPDRAIRPQPMARRAAVALAAAAAASCLGSSEAASPRPRQRLRGLPTNFSWPAYSVSSSSAVSPWGGPAFTTANSTRFHNRPLYGPHNGGLVIAGDRPIVHVANDNTLFGGLLMGLAQGGQGGVWASDAADVTSTFAPGTFAWTASDPSVPGATLTAQVYHLADGFGAVVDVNVTTTSSSSSASSPEFVFAFGCAATPQEPNRLGWLYDPLVNPSVMSWDFTPSYCAGNRISVAADNSSFTIAFANGAGTVTVDVVTSAGAMSISTASASDWKTLINGGAAAAAPASSPASSPINVAALPVAGATLWLRASSLAGAPNNSAVSTWHDESASGTDLSQPSAKLQPLFVADALGPSQPGLLFDGSGTYLSSDTAAIGISCSMFAVLGEVLSTV
jgi:hypothetical protein